MKEPEEFTRLRKWSESDSPTLTEMMMNMDSIRNSALEKIKEYKEYKKRIESEKKGRLEVKKYFEHIDHLKNNTK